MKLISASELAELSGKTWRTVKRRLEDAGIQPAKRTPKADLFASDTALAAIFIPDAGQPGELDLQEERARLAKWQADRTEQDVELRAGRLLDADAVAQWVTGMIATVKARLVQIPDGVAALIDPKQSAAVAEDVRRLIYEALAELSADGGPAPATPVAALDAAADADREPVGGPIPPSVERKRSRARAMAD